MVPSQQMNGQEEPSLMLGSPAASLKPNMPTASVQTLAVTPKVSTDTSAARDIKTNAEEADIQTLRLPMVCHELRNPLIGMQDQIGTLTRASSEITTYVQDCDAACIDEKIKTEILKCLELQRIMLQTVGVCIKYQNVLIDDVLDLSKLQAGKVELYIAPMDPKKILKDVLEVLSIQVNEKKLKVSLSDESLFWQEEVMGDAFRLQQILFNLLSYAIKATIFNEKIAITFHQPKTDQETVVFSFSIEGTGITQSCIKTLLEDKKEQAESGIKTNPNLGLSIAKALITLMNGEINAVEVKDSDGKSSKINFSVRCKKCQNLNKPASPVLIFSQPKKANTNGKHILVVDDEIVNRKIAQRVLQSAGYRCTLAENGTEAVKLCGEQVFDAILMDVQMPTMDGIEATRRIRGVETALNKKPVPIFALTATSTKAEHFDFRACGMNECLGKPFKEEQLFEMLEKYAKTSEVNLPPSVTAAVAASAK